MLKFMHFFNSFFLTLVDELQVRVLCGVDHEDLEQLLHVSKTIREAVSLIIIALFSLIHLCFN